MALKKVPVLLIALAFLQGFIYLALIPPWQHNDEPGNFEYAWLIANQAQWPQPGDFDANMRRAVAESMNRYGFYRDMGGEPDLEAMKDPVYIGIPQLDGLPLYYFLASLPLRFLRETDITLQLYYARLISIILFVITVWLSRRISEDIFGHEHPLATMTPLLLVFLPGFADKMSAVNDDVGAVVTLTLFIWASIRIYTKGVNFWRLAALAFSVALCGLAKTTAYLAIPLGVLIVLLSIFRTRTWLVWLAATSAGIAAGLIAFSWSSTSPAYFYSSLNLSLPQRVIGSQAVAGEHYFLQQAGTRGFHHTLDIFKVPDLAGKKVTIGFWAWSEKPTAVPSPQLKVDGTIVSPQTTLNLTRQPSFFSNEAVIDRDASTAILTVLPERGGTENQLYWDCFFLIDGTVSSLMNPLPLDDDCRQIGWDYRTFDSYIRNGSAEEGWPVLKPGVAQQIDDTARFSITHLWSITDMQSSGYYYHGTAAHLFRTFWGRFGWGHVPFTGNKPYRLFLGLSFAAMVGGLLITWKNRVRISWNLVLFLGLLVFLQFWMALFRAAGNWYNYIFTPTARYFYPAILPAAIILCGGWYGIFQAFFKDKFSGKTLVGISLVLLILLNGWAWYSIYSFYYL